MLEQRHRLSSELSWPEDMNVRRVGNHGEARKEFRLKAGQQKLGDGGLHHDFDLDVAKLGNVAGTTSLRTFTLDGEERVAVCSNLGEETRQVVPGEGFADDGHKFHGVRVHASGVKLAGDLQVDGNAQGNVERKGDGKGGGEVERRIRVRQRHADGGWRRNVRRAG